MVARALAPAIVPSDLPLRVFYRGDVIRCEASRLGANRELFQIGAEIIGDPSPEADVAILEIAAGLPAAFDVRPLVVYNDTAIVSRLLSAFGEPVRSALVTKRLGSLDRARIDAPAFALIERLAGGFASLADVAAWGPLADRAAHLEEIARRLDPATFSLHLDDIEDGFDYYTGIRFRVYDGESRARIAQGGRYDDLYARFGTPAAAIGLTFTIDDLQERRAGAPPAAIGSPGQSLSEVTR
jgi:ATP phosphoribosyltransferase regulatory subunit